MVGTSPVSNSPSWNPPPGATIKIASFNIQVFGDAKAEKPYVIDTICQIISNFDIVAIQEIRTQDDYFIQKFVQRLNHLSGRQYDFRVGPRLGNTRSTEQYAFIFDANRIEVHPQYVYTIRDPDNLLHREPMVGFFATRVSDLNQRFTFMLVNVHTDPDVAKEEMDALAQVYSVVRRQPIGADQQTEDDIIILGDFNTKVPSAPSGSFGRSSRPLKPDDLAGLGRITDIYPVIQNQPTNVVKSYLHDNILFHRPSTAEFTGRGGVYDIQSRHGLSLEQVKQISDHLPVWAEFSVTEAGLSNRVASGAAVGAR
nr:endonuclease/exonuclease/phosphatase family protein [Aeoliella straminimaris]